MSLFNLPIENPGSVELRKFGLVSAVIVSILFGLLLPWLFDYAWPLWPWILAATLALWGLLAADSLFVVYRVWMKFGHVAGWINTRIILGILFYVVFLPTGIIMRMLGNDPMARKLDQNMESYRVESQAADRNHVERPY